MIMIGHVLAKKFKKKPTHRSGKKRRKPKASSRIHFRLRKPAKLSTEETHEIKEKKSNPIVLIENPTQVLASEIQRVPGVLTNEELIKPNEKLQSSIEGFILNQRSEHTQTAYTKDLKRFLNYLRMRRFKRSEEGKNSTEILDRVVFIAYKDYLLNEKLEHTTIDRHLASLRSVFDWIMDDGMIEKNPVTRVRFLNPKRVSKTAGLSDEEVKKVLKQPNLHTKTGAQHYAILMMLFYCGIRRSELCSVTTMNIFKEREVYILKLRGKGNRERIIPLIGTVMNAIRYYLFISRRKLIEKGHLFTPIRNNRTGDLKKPLDPSMIYYIVQKYAKLAGIVFQVSPHSCRATAISNARDHQVSDRAIQEFAGWASTDMITRYDKRKTAIQDSAAHSIEYGSERQSRLPNWEGASMEQLLKENTEEDRIQPEHRVELPDHSN